MMHLYFAAPLFTQAEKQWNAQLAERLRYWGCKVYLPQEEPWPRSNITARLFNSHLAALESSDVVLGIIDGPIADDGTSWELGYARGKGIPTVLLRTDFRKDTNFMLTDSAYDTVVESGSNGYLSVLLGALTEATQ